jgi:hypothetical protein
MRRNRIPGDICPGKQFWTPTQEPNAAQSQEPFAFCLQLPLFPTRLAKNMFVSHFMPEPREYQATVKRRCRAFPWLGLALAVPVSASNWPGWRGSDGSGVAAETKLPLHWSTNENVLWHVPLPDRGNSTPVVWENRVLVTQATGNRRMVLCFDRHAGQVLWQSGVTWTKNELTANDNPPCTPSPVTDGQRVIAWFGSAGVHCYDLNGSELWHRDLGEQAHQWGYASSLVLYHDLCFLNFGPGDRSFVIALNKQTGRTVWQFDIPVIPSTVNRQELGGPDPSVGQAAAVKLSEIAGSWATPLIVPAGGHDELVVALPLRLVAFTPLTGEQLWSCEGPNIGAYSSPFHGDGFVAYAGCGFRNNLMVVRRRFTRPAIDHAAPTLRVRPEKAVTPCARALTGLGLGRGRTHYPPGQPCRRETEPRRTLNWQRAARSDPSTARRVAWFEHHTCPACGTRHTGHRD